MINQRRINTFVVCGLMVVVGAMTIGFAALSQRLDINGTATVKSAESSWNVYFSDVNTTGGTVGTGEWTTAPSVSTDATNSGSKNKITFACSLAALVILVLLQLLLKMVVQLKLHIMVIL